MYYDSDYDDYDYEPTPYETEVHLKEYEYEGAVYEVLVKVDTWEIRKGNYSPIASDPDEYYGEYKNTYEIMDVLYYADYEAEEGIYIHESELPKEVLKDIQYEFEE